MGTLFTDVVHDHSTAVQHSDTGSEIDSTCKPMSWTNLQATNWRELDIVATVV